MQKWLKKIHRSDIIYSTKFSRDETRLIRVMSSSISALLMERKPNLTDDLSELTGMRFGISTPPEERPLARVFPDFIRQSGRESEDETIAMANENAGLRSLNEPEILDAKMLALDCMRDSIPEYGGEVALTEAEATQWVRACNDVRLVLGTMLEIQPDTASDFMDTISEDLKFHYEIYRWFSALQELLVEVLLD